MQATDQRTGSLPQTPEGQHHKTNTQTVIANVDYKYRYTAAPYPHPNPMPPDRSSAITNMTHPT